MITKRNFRLLLVAMVLSLVVYFVLSVMTVSSLPEPLRKFSEAQWEGDLTLELWVVMGIALAAIGGLVISSVGLFRFWAPARWLFVFSTALGFVVLPLAGPTVEHAWTTVFSQLSTLLTGMVIAISYWSEARKWFEDEGS